MHYKELVTIDVIFDHFDYDREKGQFFWKKQSGTKENAVKMGQRAGGEYVAGLSKTLKYWRLTVLKKTIDEHRLVWFVETGMWPQYAIDHINGNGLDNRFDNLRDVPHKANMRNAKLRTDSTTGVTGVTFIKRLKSKPYRVHIHVSGKMKHLGACATLEEAKAVREEANLKYGYHKNHGR